jgi:hypothetical protein
MELAYFSGREYSGSVKITPPKVKGKVVPVLN